MSLAHKQKHVRQNYFATAALIYGAISWGLIWYPYRLLNESGLSGMQSSFLGYCLALLIGGILFWRRYARIVQIPASAYWLSLVAGWTNLAYILAVIDGEVMRVMLLFYLSPLWTLLLARVWLHEPWKRAQLLAIVLSLFGAHLMLTHGQWDWPLPQSTSDWLALSAGIGFSIMNVMTRFSTHLSIAAKGMLVWFGVFGLSLGLLVWQHSFSGFAWITHVTLSSYGLLLVIAFMLTSATLLVQYGVTKIPAIQASVLFMFELIVAAVAAYFLAHESISAIEMIGGVCIVAAGLLSVYDGKG
ncbi:EamA domain-containing membrane protein RarD [Methylophilus rhizosphaerae]|uniref:EamA domain-containing membrane protein RarD n=1 Tax=Methylophilus rhizosphaerae TaxID=492660 RepID=A0A1G8YZM9_9PROT|nr:DMT family transporter [Methylophilus rhizosphaerae]SDK08246.1 EamA domain-containing membrane protein RarD [Methylophilus rhizosphaerae]